MKNVIIFIFVLLITVFSIAGIVQAQNNIDENTISEIQVIEVTVQEGDSLWSIAKPYYDGEEDYRKYLSEIKELNNMDGAVIYPGQTLIIPLS